jgi:hypothetical protein
MSAGHPVWIRAKREAGLGGDRMDFTNLGPLSGL